MAWLMEILNIQLEEELLTKLRDKAFNITKNPKYDRYQSGLIAMVYKLLDKKTSGSGIKNDISNHPLDLACVAKFSDLARKLAEELQKPIIRKFKKRKAYAPFIDNIWGANLANMQLISKFNKGILFLFCVINIFLKIRMSYPLADNYNQRY